MFFNDKTPNCLAISLREQLQFNEMMMMMMMPAQLDFYSASLLTQQGRHVAPLRHIFSDLEPTPRVPKCCVLSGENTYAKCIMFGLTRPGHRTQALPHSTRAC